MDEGTQGGLDAALSRVGDRWSLLVVGSLLAGPQRFNELQASLPGIATSVLSQRLKALEAEGVVVATPYSDRPPRVSYALTSAGRELGGAVRLLGRWGSDHGGLGAEPPVHGECGTPLEVHWYCPTCARLVEDDEGTAGEAYI